MPKTMAYARQNGWEYQIGKGKHARLVKGGYRVTMPRSASDHRADLNARAFMRRYDRQQDSTG